MVSLFTVAQSSLLLSPELSSSLFPRRIASPQCGYDGKTQLQLLPGMLSPLPVICPVVSTPSLTCRNFAPSLEAFHGKRSRLNPILFYVADGLLVIRFNRWLFFPACFSGPYREDYIRRSRTPSPLTHVVQALPAYLPSPCQLLNSMLPNKTVKYSALWIANRFLA